MDIHERDFFKKSDDWIFERILHLTVYSFTPDVTFVNIKKDAVLPRSLAIAYAWYLSLIAKRKQLAEKIQTVYSPTKEVIVDQLQLVFVYGKTQLQISAASVFKYCSLQQIQQWVPEVWRTVAIPMHLSLFTSDVLFAIQDEQLLTSLFTRLPMLWLSTSGAVVMISSKNLRKTMAYQVAVVQHRLLISQDQ